MVEGKQLKLSVHNLNYKVNSPDLPNIENEVLAKKHGEENPGKKQKLSRLFVVGLANNDDYGKESNLRIYMYLRPYPGSHDWRKGTKVIKESQRAYDDGDTCVTLDTYQTCL